MDEARRVLARLRRIDALERALREELRALAPEARAWACVERDERAARAAEALAERIRSP
jgi:hypothetical protein